MRNKARFQQQRCQKIAWELLRGKKEKEKATTHKGRIYMLFSGLLQPAFCILCAFLGVTSVLPMVPSIDCDQINPVSSLSLSHPYPPRKLAIISLLPIHQNTHTHFPPLLTPAFSLSLLVITKEIQRSFLRSVALLIPQFKNNHTHTHTHTHHSPTLIGLGDSVRTTYRPTTPRTPYVGPLPALDNPCVQSVRRLRFTAYSHYPLLFAAFFSEKLSTPHHPHPLEIGILFWCESLAYDLTPTPRFFLSPPFPARTQSVFSFSPSSSHTHTHTPGSSHPTPHTHVRAPACASVCFRYLPFTPLLLQLSFFFLGLACVPFFRSAATAQRECEQKKRWTNKEKGCALNKKLLRTTFSAKKYK